MGVTLATVLAVINAGVTLTPEIVALISEVKTLFAAQDQATIDAALAQLDEEADAAHAAADAFEGPSTKA